MTFVDPMLARAAEEADLSTKDWTGWVLEPKHDGMRAIVARTDEGVQIYSRSGKTQEGKCPHLEEAFMQFPVGTILDGEIAFVESHVEIEGEQVPVVNFNKTMRIMGSAAGKAVLRQEEFGPVSFLLFDVIQYGASVQEDYPQYMRFRLADIIGVPGVVHNPRFPVSLETYEALVAAGVEGAILKDTRAPYVAGSRSKCWLKVKSAKTFDVVVMGFTDGAGKYVGQIGAIEFGAYMPDGTLKYVGRCSGMTDAERKQYTDARDSGHFFDSPTVIEVKANEMVGSGEYRTPRHPQYQHVRTDRLPESCLMSQFKA